MGKVNKDENSKLNIIFKILIILMTQVYGTPSSEAFFISLIAKHLKMGEVLGTVPIMRLWALYRLSFSSC